jgi:hypothetical protein
VPPAARPRRHSCGARRPICQGVKGERVTAAGDLAAALRRGTAATRAGAPYLIEVVVSRTGGGAESTWYQKVRPGSTSGTAEA